MIYVEQAALASPFIKHLDKLGHVYQPLTDIHEVPDSKSEIIVRHRRDMYCRPCPATKLYCCCNYHTTDVMEGCPYDCTYCILQAYLGHKNIVVSADIESIAGDIRGMIAKGDRRRLGTGELSDSLALDSLFQFTKIIVPIINDQDIIQFEFKTKSVNIKNLLELNPKNIVVSWSLNPHEIAVNNELGTASIQARLQAAKTCAEYGYKVAFHFDPIIYGYDAAYKRLCEELTETVPAAAVEYVSLSTFRAPAKLIEQMRLRPDSPEMLRHDMVRGVDGKLRYFRPLRQAMIGGIVDILRERWSNVFLYLCMEHTSVWEHIFDSNLAQIVQDREGLESLFPHMR
jgi:spore photoproduct lyase